MYYIHTYEVLGFAPFSWTGLIHHWLAIRTYLKYTSMYWWLYNDNVSRPESYGIT